MRVMRESSWGKLINNQVTRWVGSRQIDMRARGTQKTRTEATCSHKTETQAHGQQTNHQPCAKQDMNTQLWQHGARVSEPRHVTETQDMSAGIQTPRSNMKQGTQTRERATRAHSKPRAHMKTRTWWEYQGSVTKPRITLDRSDRTLTLSFWRCLYITGSKRCQLLPLIVACKVCIWSAQQCVRFVFCSVPCSCFHVFYFEV